MSGPSGIFYGRMATPTAAKGTLPPEGQVAFYIDNTNDHFMQIDSDGTILDLTTNFTPGINTLTDAATITTDCDSGNVHSVTLGGNRTLGAPTNLKNGASYAWFINQDATGSRTLSYNAIFDFGGNTPILATQASAVEIILGTYDGTKIRTQFLNHSSTDTILTDSSGNITFDGQTAPKVDTLVSGTNTSVNCENGNLHFLGNAGAGEIDNYTLAKPGSKHVFLIEAIASAGAITWGTKYDFGTAGAPTVGTTLGDTIRLTGYKHPTKDVMVMSWEQGYSV